MARRAGDDLVTRAMLVALDRVGEKLRVLPREARPGGNHADTLPAVAARARGGGSLARRRIAHGRRLRPRGRLPRIEQRHVIALALAHPREQRLLEALLAVTRHIGLHRGDEILRVLSDQARRSGPPRDPALAVACRAGDDLAARSLLVGPDRVGEIERVLAGEARPGGSDADA